MNKKTLGVILLVVGVVILILSLAADPLGIGAGNVVFGPRQIAGTIVGAVLAVVGLILRLRK